MCRAGPARNDQFMATALLDRPAQDPATTPPAISPLTAGLAALPGAALPGAAAVAPAAAAARKRWARAGAVAVLAVAAAAFGVELSQANLADVLARVQPWQAAAAAGWIALSLVAAAYNLTGFSAVRVPLWRSLQAQLAISGLRVFTPSAVSTPVVATRFLIRSGSDPSDALATAGAAQAVQLVATFAVVAALAAVSGASGPGLPSPVTVGAIALGLAVALIVALLAARRSERARRALLEARASTARLARHARSHPAQALGGLLASAALTLTHILAFAACVTAAGGHLPVLTLAAIYLGAATAGSLLPTPGGIGGVEAALIAGLTAAGVSMPVATAATVLSRLVAVWLPAIPGWWAALRLRQAGLL
jgi:glycosyltransferase 2 family protein